MTSKTHQIPSEGLTDKGYALVLDAIVFEAEVTNKRTGKTLRRKHTFGIGDDGIAFLNAENAFLSDTPVIEHRVVMSIAEGDEFEMADGRRFRLAALRDWAFDQCIEEVK